MNLTNIHESWNVLHSHKYSDKLLDLRKNVLPNISYQPNSTDIFKPFEMPMQNIKVVILGQEPSVTPKGSTGLAFASNYDSYELGAINKEILISQPGSNLSSFFSDKREWNNLHHWAAQGVFLLNTSLTVETGKQGSHAQYWKDFTRRIISTISESQPCIWVLWGEHAKTFIPYISHYIRVNKYGMDLIDEMPRNPGFNYLMTSPAPISEYYLKGKAGFYGCNHFYYINVILKSLRREQIKW